MSELNGIKPHTCGECRHWHRQPPNPQNLKEVLGQCRFMPPIPQALTAQNGPQVGVVGFINAWPSMPPQHPICGQFVAKVALTIGGAD